MLTHLRLENFKSFRQLDLPLRPLTLLSGLNGMGKSTVLQALLMLRQSFLDWPFLDPGTVRGFLEERHREWFKIRLNGSYIQLGSVHDVLCRLASSDHILIGLEGDELPKGFQLRFEPDTGRHYYSVNPVMFEFIQHGAYYSLSQYSSVLSSNFRYLQAERLGPRTTFQTREGVPFDLGCAGEYTAQFLNYWSLEADKPLVVQKQLRHTKSLSSNLSTQVAAWMGEVSPGAKMETQPVEGTDLIRLRFGFGDSDMFRPSNVGFGMTYTLPVVTALVAAQSGQLILLENPEAHLHPRGQVTMGNLIARAASSGVQVLLETHSDHVLNGIRIAARQGLISANDVALHFFQRDESSNYSSTVVSPRLSSNGRLDFWPDGFFDEWDKSLDALI